MMGQGDKTSVTDRWWFKVLRISTVGFFAGLSTLWRGFSNLSRNAKLGVALGFMVLVIAGSLSDKHSKPIDAAPLAVEPQAQIDASSSPPPERPSPTIAEAPQAPQWEASTTYNHYTDGSCKPSEKVVCLSNDEAERMCKAADGTNGLFVEYFTNSLYGGEAQLVRNNGISGTSIMWSEGNCYAKISAQGTVDGNSMRRLWTAKIMSFYYTENGKLLASTPDPVGITSETF